MNIHIEQVKNISRQNYRNYPGYIAFPLRKTNGSLLKEGLEFSLNVTYAHKYQKDIQAALWAWETFGGVGARTRRGFGSITQCDSKEYPKNARDFTKWLLGNYEKYYKDDYLHSDLPNLADIANPIRFKIFYKTRKQGLFGMWRDLIEQLKYFRQAKNTDGTSLWPEPNQIRRITKQHLKYHNPNNAQAGQQYKVIKAFPRAQFGLPIIFQFKDNDESFADDPNSDPKPTTLELVNPNDSDKKGERLASPLILKTFQCANGDIIGLAFILSGTELSPKMELVLKDNKGNSLSSKPEDLKFLLEEDEKIDIGISEVKGNILEAFLAYLKEKMPQ